jgi:hypothetical protein
MPRLLMKFGCRLDGSTDTLYTNSKPRHEEPINDIWSIKSYVIFEKAFPSSGRKIGDRHSRLSVSILKSSKQRAAEIDMDRASIIEASNSSSNIRLQKFNHQAISQFKIFTITSQTAEASSLSRKRWTKIRVSTLSPFPGPLSRSESYQCLRPLPFDPHSISDAWLLYQRQLFLVT